MKNKEYKAIFVPPELHHRFKGIALRRRKTMIEMIQDTCDKAEKRLTPTHHE